MSALTIFSDTQADTPLWQSRDAEQIAQQLAQYHIRFERWQADRPLAADPDNEQVLLAYQHEIVKLVAEKGYQSWDVISIGAEHPDKDTLRKRFLSEHTHAEDEVRFFVQGAGLFCLHVADKVLQILCEKNDLISVPAGVAHWFDMGATPSFTAIRIFDNPQGWIAHFTGSDIADHYPHLS